MDHVDSVQDPRTTLGQHEPTVELRDRDGKASRTDFPVEHRAVDVEIRSVRGKAERNAGQPMDDQGRHGRVVGKVRVHVANAATIHLVGEPHRLRQDRDAAEEEVPAPARAAQDLPPGPAVGGRRAAEEMQLARRIGSDTNG